MKKAYNYILSAITFLLVGVCIFYCVQIRNSYKEIELMKQEVASISANAIKLYKISEMMSLYEDNYINELEDGDYYTDIMLKAMSLASNDKYGLYFTSQEAAGVEKELSGEYQGIGIIVLYPENEDYIVVDKVYEGMPAEKAGIKVGDKITKINGIPTREEEGIKELQMLSTSGASEVVLTINDKDITVSLEKVHVDAIKTEVNGTTGIITINSFTETSGNEFIEKFDKLLKENKIENLIFDVRDNGGGDKIAVTQIIDRLAPEGEIYTESYKYSENVVKSDKECVDIPIYILGNENSASASELFIMALQDTNDATFIGTKTFGKSTILGYFPFEDGSSVFMSVGYYYPPSDRFIEGIGIEPDIIEENDAMKRALELINN